MPQKIPAALASFVIATISAGGYLGIVGLMAIESACIPIPSEIIMPFSGYLVSTGRFDLLLVATAGAVGCNIGSTIAYVVGRYGGLAVLLGRLLPVVRTFIALPAGIARLPQLRFQIYTFIGSWPWCFGLAYIGYKLGERWNSDPRLQAIMHRLDLLVLALIALALCWYVWRHL